MKKIQARNRVFVYAAALAFLLFATTSHAQNFINPLSPDLDTIPEFISGALKVLVQVAIPIITLFLVISGFMFIVARGNSTKLEKAKNNFLYVIFGALLILGAWALSQLIGGTVSEILPK